MLPKHVRYQTALHPVNIAPAQATMIIVLILGDAVKYPIEKICDFVIRRPRFGL